MIEEKIKIPCADGYELGGLWLRPDIAPKAVIQFQGGTGVKKEFYLNFCRFLAEHGFAVVMYDYRGIGESRPPKMKGFPATMQDWGRLDMTGVLNWIDWHYPNLKKIIVGHSIGGQLIGLMVNHEKLSACIAIASSTGSWRLQTAPRKYVAAFLWYFLSPALNGIYGYAALKKLGIMEDLPKKLIQEWGEWCKKEDYFASFIGKTIHEHYFTEVSMPFVSYWMTDDYIANEKTVTSLLNNYPNAPKTFKQIRPADYGAEQIGHFGFFSRKFTDTLWTEILKDLSVYEN